MFTKHPLISVFKAPEEHPYSKKERACTLLIGVCFSVLISVLIQVDGDPTKALANHPPLPSPLPSQDPALSSLCGIVLSLIQVIAEQASSNRPSPSAHCSSWRLHPNISIPAGHVPLCPESRRRALQTVFLRKNRQLAAGTYAAGRYLAFARDHGRA